MVEIAASCALKFEYFGMGLCSGNFLEIRIGRTHCQLFLSDTCICILRPFKNHAKL